MIRALIMALTAIGFSISVAHAGLSSNGGTNGMRTGTSFVSQNLVGVEIGR